MPVITLKISDLHIWQPWLTSWNHGFQVEFHYSLGTLKLKPLTDMNRNNFSLFDKKLSLHSTVSLAKLVEKCMKIDEKLSPLFFQNSWVIDYDQIKLIERLNEHFTPKLIQGGINQSFSVLPSELWSLFLARRFFCKKVVS